METISVIIETPAGSGQKFTFDPAEGRMKLKKILPKGMFFPFDFGFIPGTRGGDGDPLDVLVISESPTFSGCLVECRIIGAFIVEQQETTNSTKMIRNDRFLAVPTVSLEYAHIHTMGDLSKTLTSQLEAFFVNYIEQEEKKIKIKKRVSAKEALQIISQFKDSTDTNILFEIFLPIKDNRGKTFSTTNFDKLQKVLTEKFGGVTIHKRSPVKGIWSNPDSKNEKDELIIIEVMASNTDKLFWSQLKKKLEKQFNQDEILIRNSVVHAI